MIIELNKYTFIFRSDDNVRDNNGNKCVWEGDKTGFVVEDPVDGKSVPCVKGIGYYQWIPYVLLLQVSR